MLDELGISSGGEPVSVASLVLLRQLIDQLLGFYQTGGGDDEDGEYENEPRGRAAAYNPYARYSDPTSEASRSPGAFERGYDPDMSSFGSPFDEDVYGAPWRGRRSPPPPGSRARRAPTPRRAFYEDDDVEPECYFEDRGARPPPRSYRGFDEDQEDYRRPRRRPVRDDEEDYRPRRSPVRDFEEDYRPPRRRPMMDAEEDYRPRRNPVRDEEEDYRPPRRSPVRDEEDYRPPPRRRSLIDAEEDSSRLPRRKSLIDVEEDSIRSPRRRSLVDIEEDSSRPRRRSVNDIGEERPRRSSLRADEDDLDRPRRRSAADIEEDLSRPRRKSLVDEPERRRSLVDEPERRRSLGEVRRVSRIVDEEGDDSEPQLSSSQAQSEVSSVDDEAKSGGGDVQPRFQAAPSKRRLRFKVLDESRWVLDPEESGTFGFNKGDIVVRAQASKDKDDGKPASVSFSYRPFQPANSQRFDSPDRSS